MARVQCQIAVDRAAEVDRSADAPSRAGSAPRTVAAVSCHGWFVLEVRDGDNFEQGFRRGTLLMLAIALAILVVFLAAGL